MERLSYAATAMRVTSPYPEHRLSLSRCRVFDDLPLRIVDEIFASCELRQYDPGDYLMEMGAAGDALLLLVKGKATASLRRDGTSEPIATFGPDEIVGEMALVTGEPRTADVRADGEVLALALPATDFHRIAKAHPLVGLVLTRLIGDRLGANERDGMGDKQVDRYQIERCVGRGATAMVYRARDVEQGGIVALKMMSHRLVYESGATKRFQREADLLLALEHRHVARVYRRFPAFGTNFIVMEFHPGRTLDDAIYERGALDEREARPLLGQLASALSYLHKNGIVHRDLKPGNIMMAAAGATLTDFGLAKAGSKLQEVTEETSQLAFAGTPLYMAPEQIRGGEANARTDLYAFGCVAYELLVGARPFVGSNLNAMIEEKLSYRVPKRRSIGNGISCRMHALLRACLAVDPARRRVDLDGIAQWASKATQ